MEDYIVKGQRKCIQFHEYEAYTEMFWLWLREFLFMVDWIKYNLIVLTILLMFFRSINKYN